MRNARLIIATLGIVVLCRYGLGSRVSIGQRQAPIWGHLANAGFENERIRATLFFPGQARDGSQPYNCYAGSNMGLYTVVPQDGIHLRWSESRGNRQSVVKQMIATGVNVIAMSTWGEDFLPCSTGWSWWAPMQSAPQSQDELFAATEGQPIFVMPFIESRADWAFRSEFPKWGDQVAPGTVNQIVNLLERYAPQGTRGVARPNWAQVYDRQGLPRYAVAIIHASSDQLNAYEHARFAQGFAAIEQEVFTRTGLRVGFFLDVLPPDTYAPGRFRPSAQWTGPHLKNETSLLGIMCFIPEVWIGSSSDSTVINWKRNFSEDWAATGIPFLMDISPGYDAHIVFPGSVRYGLNLKWMTALTLMVQDYGQDGLMFNSWNGYTEAMAAVPTNEFGHAFYSWLSTLTCIHADETCRDRIRCLGQGLAGDINQDCVIDFKDLALLAADWLQTDTWDNSSTRRR